MKTWQVIDAREMFPPKPLERVLEAIDQLPQGEEIQLLIDREPTPLYGILARYHFAHETRLEPDGHFVIRIWHAA